MATTQSASVLDGAPPREGWTKFCADFFNTPIPVDDVTASEARLLQARMDFNATVAAIQHGKQTSAIRRSVLVSNN